MSTKESPSHEVPTPPLPKSLLDKKDPEYEAPEPLKPDDIRARLQLQTVTALDILDWHARNLGDPKSSIDACKQLLDRAGYVAPTRSSGEGVFTPAGGGSVLPPIEEDTKAMAEAFSGMPSRGRPAESDED